ncbi:hypothetical protein CCH79_00002696, partial [Gambusia affinis]
HRKYRCDTGEATETRTLTSCFVSFFNLTFEFKIIFNPVNTDFSEVKVNCGLELKCRLQFDSVPEMSLWYFIACFSLTCCLVSGQNTKYALVGEKVEFTGFNNKEIPTDILWKHIEGHSVYKVVHFDGSQEKLFGSYEGRVTLDWRSADLSISNLRYEDSGLYDLEIQINNKQMTKRYELIVIDRVTKPTISCEINNASTSESAGKATLLCSLPSHSDQSLLKFQWSTNAKIQPGHMLKIPLRGEFDDHQYNCTVNNPLTQESAVFFAKDCYHETKAQAGLIAGVVVAVILLLIVLLIVVFCLKKVRSNHKKSDVETQSNPRFSKATSGSEEIRVLLDRAPTLPSKHSLGHLNQGNDTPLDPFQKDEAHMNELRESIRRRSSSVQDGEIPFSSSVKQLSLLPEKKNGQANEAEPRDIVEEEVLENNPSDSESMNPELTALSSESKQNKDEEDNRASHPHSESQRSNLVQNVSALKEATEDTEPEDKRPVSNDSSDSGNPNEVPENQNSGSKKEENEFAKSTPENDVQPPPVAKENSPLSQNSPESSPKAEHKQDIDSDECAMTNSGEPSSSSLEESENEEPVPPASTPKKTDSETTVEEQKPALSETKSEMETLQNK